LSKNESFIHMAEWILLLTQQKLLSDQHVCIHTCAKTPTPLVSCIVNDAVVHRMPSVQQNVAITFYAFNSLNAVH